MHHFVLLRNSFFIHFLAQNSRFLILADRAQLPNLGSRAMKLGLERSLGTRFWRWKAPSMGSFFAAPFTRLPKELQPYEKPPRARCEHSLAELSSLRERLAAGVKEFRKGQGQRHRIPTVLSIR